MFNICFYSSLVLTLMKLSLARTVVRDFKDCSSEITPLNLKIDNAILQNGVISNDMDAYYNCSFEVIPSGFTNVYIIYLNFIRFSLFSKIQRGISGFLIIRSEMMAPISFRLMGDSDNSDIDMSSEMVLRSFNWKNKFRIEMILLGQGQIEFSLMLVNYYYCDKLKNRNDFFKCDISFLMTDVCISTDLVCDRIQNCMNLANDEAQSSCKNQSSLYIFIIMIVFLVLMSCAVWLVLRFIPCLRPRARIPSNQMTTLNNQILDNQMRSATLMTISTPDGITPGPPMYLSTDDKEVGFLALPPDYSDENQFAITSSFLKRFFGVNRKDVTETPDS